MKRKIDLVRALDKYLPEGTTPIIADWMEQYPVRVRITKPRQTKLGDYRPPGKDSYHRISINNDLNRYAFLITLVHEFAHMVTWMNHQHRVKPHGTEWKESFKKLMQPVVSAHNFPSDILNAIELYLRNPKAASCSDKNLTKVLRSYDPPTNKVLLEELPDQAYFTIHNGRQFQKIEKRRTRYKCLDLQNHNYYLISGMAEVIFLQ